MKLDLQALKSALRASVMLDLAELDSMPQALGFNSDAVLNKILDRYEDNKGRQSRLSGRRLIAVIIAAVIIIASAVSVIAYKEKLLRFFETKEDTHTSLDSIGTEGANDRVSDVFLPSYMPDGYTMISHESSSVFALTLWQSGEKDILFSQMPIKNVTHVMDTEREDYREAVFGGQGVYYTVGNDTFDSVWHTEDYVYTLMAPYELGLDELEKIISSLSFYKNIE